MKLEDKIDQLLIYGFADKPLWETGGIILFERNVKDTRNIKRRNQKYHKSFKIPPIIAIDQEGGTVNRIKSGVHLLPRNDLLGVVGSRKTVYQCGALLGKELTEFRIDLNLAPVVDVNTEIKNPIIGSRSFGADPQKVAELGRAYIRGMQRQGLLSCAKHFPGHGASQKDSHRCLPKININKHLWSKVHLLPFQAAIKAGVKFIMVAHILCPALDRKEPASLSHKIITKLLKKKLGYRGIVITDDFVMDAIVKHYRIEDAAVKAIRAGIDMIICGRNVNVQKKIRKSLIKAFRSGVLTQKRLDESVDKILKLKKMHFGSKP